MTADSSPADAPDTTTAHWSVYIIEATDGRLYTGITTHIERRWHQHSATRQGAKFFRGRQPRQLCYIEHGHDRSSASRREAVIKKLTRAQKLLLIAEQPPVTTLLTDFTRDDQRAK